MNLSDAATKLKEVISNAAATTSEGRSVFQVYLKFTIKEFLPIKEHTFFLHFLLLFLVWRFEAESTGLLHRCI